MQDLYSKVPYLARHGTLVVSFSRKTSQKRDSVANRLPIWRVLAHLLEHRQLQVIGCDKQAAFGSALRGDRGELGGHPARAGSSRERGSEGLIHPPHLGRGFVHK